MISCKEAAQLISESMDRRIPLRRRIPLKLHLLMCRFCPRFLEQMLFLRKAAGRYTEEVVRDADVQSFLTTEARERIRQALADGA